MNRATLKPSRGGTTSPLGKLAGWLPRQRIEEEIVRRLERRAAAIAAANGVASKPTPEVIRDMVRVAVLGRDEALRLYGAGVLVGADLVAGKSDVGS